MPSGAGRGKSCKGSAPRGGLGVLQAADGSGSEGGGRGWEAEPAEIGGGDGGGSSRHRAAAVPGALLEEYVRGGGLEAWRVVCGRLEWRRPSHRALGSTGVAPRPRGSDVRTLRVGGWGGLRHEDLRRSCTMSGEDANGGGGRWCAL